MSGSTENICLLLQIGPSNIGERRSEYREHFENPRKPHKRRISPEKIIRWVFLWVLQLQETKSERKTVSSTTREVPWWLLFRPDYRLHIKATI